MTTKPESPDTGASRINRCEIQRICKRFVDNYGDDKMPTATDIRDLRALCDFAYTRASAGDQAVVYVETSGLDAVLNHGAHSLRAYNERNAKFMSMPLTPLYTRAQDAAPMWAIYKRNDEAGEWCHAILWHNETVLEADERYVFGHFTPSDPKDAPPKPSPYCASCDEPLSPQGAAGKGVEPVSFRVRMPPVQQIGTRDDLLTTGYSGEGRRDWSSWKDYCEAEAENYRKMGWDIEYAASLTYPTKPAQVGQKDAQDAARYRWLREHDRVIDEKSIEDLLSKSFTTLDAMIDEAIGAVVAAQDGDK